MTNAGRGSETRWFRMLASEVVLVSLVFGPGCGRGDPSAAQRPSATNEVFSVDLTVSAPSSLPKCTSSISGTTAFVQSPPSLWACVGGTWAQIPCTDGLAGSVAYASATKTLWACVSGTWTQI